MRVIPCRLLRSASQQQHGAATRQRRQLSGLQPAQRDEGLMEGFQGECVDIVGWYSFQYEGGEFAVCFRPGGKFFCNEYQAPATWAAQGDQVIIDWKSYGEYEMKVDPATKAMEGCVKGTPGDWRKATFVKPLSPVESLLFGAGGGTEWKFEYSGGSFGVQFKADGYNHFNCPSYPEHSHYILDTHNPPGNMIEIDWGKFGTYVMAIDPETKTMQGSTKGVPDDWRRATYVKDLASKAGGTEFDHLH